MAGPLREDLSLLEGYERLAGAVPVIHPPGMEGRAEELRRLLEAGVRVLSEVLDAELPALCAMLMSDEDWEAAPREGEHAYPRGLPYFTRSVRPPALVLPVVLPPVLRPRTEATYPLVVWHELAHAFLLRREVVRTPAWLREFAPQAASAAVAMREGLPLREHLGEIDREPGFTVRTLRGHAGADEQMDFQNLLLALGAAAVEEFGDGFLGRLAHALWGEAEVVDEGRAEELLSLSFGPGGRKWLASRPEY